jgi:formylglycine-generating enzyme required for sulfatase activity
MNDDREKIEENIRQLEALKASGAMPIDLADASIAALKEKLATYDAELDGGGAIAQGQDSMAVGQDSIGIRGGVSGVFTRGDGNQIIQNPTIIVNPVPQDARSLSSQDALRYYLENIIAAHQHLRLQGIRAGSQPLSVALEKVYVSLTAVDQRAAKTEPAPGLDFRESGSLTIAEALNRYRRLVIIGDPGCGKTTLLSYIALTYARSLRSLTEAGKAGGENTVQKRLRLNEFDCLPVLLPLRNLGGHLKEKHPDPGKDGPAILLNYLFEYYQNQSIALPEKFFDAALEKGKAVLLLDGMDEVAEAKTRQRVARLIEKFAERYPECRFIVTSRVVGYEGAARIGAEFGLAKVRELSNAEVRQFLRDWTRVVESALAGSAAPEILRLADEQSGKLIQAIDHNPRVAELAVNPLLLIVIALVHRYRAQLPERRSELYEEAVEVLLGYWDEAKGLETDLILAGRALDGGDRRSLLEPVAFWLHEHKKRELERDDLRDIWLPKFLNMTGGDKAQAAKAVEAFLTMINQRSGLLIERGVGVYGFAHLTFQEYLASRVLAEREDALVYSLKVLPDSWWREVILLEAGYLSNQGTRRVSVLIRAILDADPKTEPEPHHHLLLAAECLFDVGPARVEGNLLGEARQRLKQQADTPFKKGDKAAVLAKITASNALARLESGQVTTRFWKLPYGEPEWVTIPAGEFWMGGADQYDGKPVHQVSLPEYQIARVPITNAQYALYIQDAQVNPPAHWRGGSMPSGRENHPVVNISWEEALVYCQWLGAKLEKSVSLPSEAEWEKAARGDQDQRAYPWGDVWKELQCNSSELGLKETTPVGLFLGGASPYGLLDMSGNVWEWTRTISNDKFNYPYRIKDGRENLQPGTSRVLRGGSFYGDADGARCACRGGNPPDHGFTNFGFRVVVSVVSRASL